MPAQSAVKLKRCHQQRKIIFIRFQIWNNKCDIWMANAKYEIRRKKKCNLIRRNCAWDEWMITLYNNFWQRCSSDEISSDFGRGGPKNNFCIKKKLVYRYALVRFFFGRFFVKFDFFASFRIFIRSTHCSGGQMVRNFAMLFWAKLFKIFGSIIFVNIPTRKNHVLLCLWVKMLRKELIFQRPL